MKVYVFGNQDLPDDSVAIEFAKAQLIEGIEFVFIKPNEDLPFIGLDRVVILDVVDGIDDIKIFNQDYLDHLHLPPRNSAHDFDLAFQLKYLKKLGKLGEVIFVGIPMTVRVKPENIKRELIRLQSKLKN